MTPVRAEGRDLRRTLTLGAPEGLSFRTSTKVEQKEGQVNAYGQLRGSLRGNSKEKKGREREEVKGNKNTYPIARSLYTEG